MSHSHRQAFIDTKKYYGITNKALYDHTGVSQSHISEYINKKRNMTTDLLDKLVDAMEELEPGARKYYCELLLGKSFVNIREMVSNMSLKEMSQVMAEMADALDTANSHLMVS